MSHYRAEEQTSILFVPCEKPFAKKQTKDTSSRYDKWVFFFYLDPWPFLNLTLTTNEKFKCIQNILHVCNRLLYARTHTQTRVYFKFFMTSSPPPLPLPIIIIRNTPVRSFIYSFIQFSFFSFNFNVRTFPVVFIISIIFFLFFFVFGQLWKNKQ